MKRKSFYVAILAAFSLLASCNKVQQLEPTGSSAGDFFKTVKVDLGAATKAVSESAVNDATLFVYQNNGKTGESILYHQVYGPGSTFEVDLLFSDQTTYTYDIKAYANMGELAAEGGEVLFTGESESGLQLHGQSLSVGEADASAVTVDMSRYVGKVTVSKVAVDWTNDHGQQDLKLVSVYLANVPGKVGGEPEYNVGGGFVSSAMDALIYRPVGSEIADGESYTTAQSMYGYAGTDCALVLECELAGEKMYYHVPYSPAANSHRAFKITIRQNGADTPMGELAQEAIEVSVVTLNVLDYDESDSDVEFGKKPVNPIANYLTIEALEDGLTASLSANALANSCEYCVDGDGNWKTLTAGTATETINTGQTLSFRGNLTPTGPMGIGTFSISKKCNLKGNCMSMLFGDNAANVNSLEGVDFAFFNLFYSCTNIINVSPDFLPATTLAANCYSGMFSECTSLTTAPELPATTLAENCYGSMFMSCTNLTTVPELPATTLAPICYNNMFNNCTRLTAAPELPATTLTEGCYESMFYNCTSLTAAPELPATKLESICYACMFFYCTSLTTAPALPATTLAEGCYSSMFGECISLTIAPELPATTLKAQCYAYMFYGCKKINYIKMLATDISASNCLSNWVYNVASLGTFVKSPDMTTLTTGNDGIPSLWSVMNDGEEQINTDNYLTIEALEDGLTASLSTNAVEYCVDGDGNWKTLAAGTTTETINTGQTLSFRGNLTPNKDMVNGNIGIGTFTIDKKCNLKGNCMSLLFWGGAANINSLEGIDCAFANLFGNNTNIINVSPDFLPATTLADYCYYYMFWNCTSLTTTPKLPATTLAKSCYGDMFRNCTSLITPPSLPSTTLARNCYQYMFYDCTSLTAAPELPVTTLTEGCYTGMFLNCTSLTATPELPATTLADYCYSSMFNGCSSLTTAPELPVVKLKNNCYSNMFAGCTSLTTAPTILPATTLTTQCYYRMFEGCTNLTTAPVLPATTLNDYCYFEMFDGCSSLTTAPELPATTLANNCYGGMFKGCKSLTTAPELPAMTMTRECYESMFYNCTSLTTAPELPATTLAPGCYDDMFAICTSLTTAPELPATTLAESCYGAMFYGCKKINYIKMLATDISASNCLSNWVYNVASLGTFVKSPDMTTLTTGNDGIPSGWTVIDNNQ